MSVSARPGPLVAKQDDRLILINANRRDFGARAGRHFLPGAEPVSTRAARDGIGLIAELAMQGPVGAEAMHPVLSRVAESGFDDGTFDG